MTNYIIPKDTPADVTIDTTQLSYPCRITDLRNGEEIVMESAESNPVPIGLQADQVSVPASFPANNSADIQAMTGPGEANTAFDTDLNKPVWLYDGTWYDASGNAAYSE